jgi:DNA polymerase III alpha subunit
MFDGHLYWEIQPTQTESQRIYNQALLDMCGGNDQFKLVATGDPHYMYESDRDLHQKFLAARNSRNAGWEYPFKGEHHVLDENEIVNLFTLLHGKPMLNDESFCRAFEQPEYILGSVEQYDLRQQTRVPNFVE